MASLSPFRNTIRSAVARQGGRLNARPVAPLAQPCASPPAARMLSVSSRRWKQETTDDPAEASKLSDKANDASFDAAKKPADGEASAELTALQEQIKQKDARIKELTDAVLYGKADLQNLQRRATEEKTAASDYGISRLARDLTSSLDILHLALKSVPESLRSKPAGASDAEDPKKVLSELYSGVDMTSKSLLDMLKTHGITSFDPTGEKFNPQEHEALYQAPVPGKEPGSVLDCSKIGYRIKGRVLRPAQVGVVQESG